MRVVLWCAQISGDFAFVAGALIIAEVWPSLRTQPTIAVYPDLALGFTLCSFGVIASAIGAAALLLHDSALRQEALLDRIAAAVAAPPDPLPEAHPAAVAAAPRPAKVLAMRPCAGCGHFNRVDQRACTRCGAALSAT